MPLLCPAGNIRTVDLELSKQYSAQVFLLKEKDGHSITATISKLTKDGKESDTSYSSSSNGTSSNGTSINLSAEFKGSAVTVACKTTSAAVQAE